MAIYHLTCKLISRGKGQSAVRSAAYRSGENLHDDRLNCDHDFSRKEKVEYKEVLLPNGSPEEFKDRNAFWNAIEKSEKRKDAQLAREIEFSLPKEFSLEKNIALAKRFLQETLVSDGMAADMCIHNKDGQPHCHAMLSTREVNQLGIAAKKNRSWNTPEKLKSWRKAWEVCCNKELSKHNIPLISAESLENQGVDRLPTVHEGVFHRAENRERNRQIREINAELEKLKTEIKKFKEQQRAAEPSESPQKRSGWFFAPETTSKTNQTEKTHIEPSRDAEQEEKELLNRMAAKYKTKGKLSPSDIADLKIHFRNKGTDPEQNAQTLARYGFSTATICTITKVRLPAGAEKTRTIEKSFTR